MKYIRLLRLQDQYLQLGSVLMSSLYLNRSGLWLIYWVVATLFISFTAFIVNEWVDKDDTDRFSWNPIHIQSVKEYNPKIVILLFAACSIVGLFFSLMAKLFWFGLAMYVIGIIYSVKPIRLKSRFGVDLLAQILVWFLIPFLAPVWLLGANFTRALIFDAVIILLLVPVGLPYQLADYLADLKAGLKGTHLVLGMKNSVLFGVSLAILGIFIFFWFQIYARGAWISIFIVYTVYSIYRSIDWYKMTAIEQQTNSMQKYVKRIKPLTQFLIPYLVLVIILNNFFGKM